MLRPERMSRVSVTGSKQVMEPAVEAIYDLNLVDVSEYDGGWAGFEPGTPAEGADEAAEKLVTVRSLQSTLGVDEDDAGPTRLVTEEALEEELEEVRQRVNDLDDRRNELEDELRAVEERIDAVAPFVALGLDLDLLSGYDSLSVAVGQGDAADIEATLADADGVDAFQVFSDDEAVAVFVHPAGDVYPDGLEVSIPDLLVGARFQAYEVPDAEGSPEEYISELRQEKQQLESELETVESELESLKLEVAGFLLAAEEKLTVETQKAEAPLSFATTRNAFIAEGWLPTDEYDRLVAALETAVGDRVDVEELERAEYDEDGVPEHVEEVEERDRPAGEPAPTAGEPVTAGAGAENGEAAPETAEEQEQEKEPVADGGSAGATSGASSEPRSDGGHAGGLLTMGGDSPPVVMDNPAIAKPFELLVETVERPRYGEFDPTIVLFLTFPAFFGFMIGDVGYGLMYMGLGYLLYGRFDSPGIRSLGGIGMWAGGFTVLFGVLYGEFFGLHFIGKLYGGPVMEKGIQPAGVEYARAWLLVAAVVGLLHMAAGYALDFVNNLEHGLKDAFTESGAWVLLFVGIWAWIFSRSAEAMKPEFIFHAFAGEPLPFGFAGFSTTGGTVALVLAVVGFVGVAAGEVEHMGVTGLIPAFLEGIVGALSNVLSYARLTAVLLAKAGMALVVNLLFFGMYTEPTGHGVEFHYMLNHGPEWVAQNVPEAEIVFGGLMHGGIAALLLGVVVLVVGHLLVLALGVTSAGLQAVRLEYVEFFGKFYEGGGREYKPFGHDRQFTTED